MTKEAFFLWVEREFGVKPDYPWEERNAVLRHGDSRKWFALVLEVERCKLGLQGQGKVEVLNVKGDPRIIGSLKGQPGYFPAYHMNKEQWLSILLDGPVGEGQIQELLRMSFDLTRGKARVSPPKRSIL